jgi:hypothetical protein
MEQLAAQLTDKLPEGANKKTCYSENPGEDNNVRQLHSPFR